MQPPTPPGADPYGQPGVGPPWYGQPQYGQPQYGQPQYGQPQYGQPQYGQPQYGQPGGFGYGWPAPKPGCVPLRPLNVGEILDGSFQVVRRNPRATLGLAAIIAVISAAVSTTFVVLTDNININTTTQDDGTSRNVGLLGGELSGAFSVLVLGTLLGAILTGMLAAVVTEDVLGVKLTIGQAWQRARSRMWALFGLALVTTILEVLGLIPCLVIGVYLWGVWAVAVPAMMVEGTSVWGSLRRSRRLVNGTFWRVWGIRALGTILLSLVSALIAGPFTLIGLFAGGDQFGDPHLSAVYIAFTAVGSIISTTVTAPVRAAVDALLYVDLRMRKEGLDLVLQQRAAQLAVPGRI